MRVLTITGDRRFGPGHERYELQKSAVEALGVMYWGRGSYFPRLLAGTWDAVTVQDPFFRGLFAWHVARKLRARLNVQVHADLTAQPRYKRALARFVLRRADSVRVVSQRLKEQVERIAPRAKVTVLPVYIDLERFSAIVPQPHAQKTILWVGRFEPEKDPLAALRVFADVRATVPDARLVMLGAGSLEPQLRDFYTRSNLGGAVEFAGWGDPTPQLAAADVVLSTSRTESYGASIIEALAAGVPVVAPDVGVAREAGATVAPRERLASAIVDALRTGARGQLMLPVLTKEAWTAAWAASLQ